MKDLYAEIAVELPLENTFTYGVPGELKSCASIGKRALVPFGKRTISGYIVSLTHTPPENISEVKPIIDVMDETPLFDEKRLNFYRWMAQYYFAPLGEVLALTHPAGSNIQSSRKITLTEKGRAALETSDGMEKEVLNASKNSTTVSALFKRFRNRPVYSLVERLKRKGLIDEEVVLKGGSKEKTIRCVRLTDPSDTEPDLKRSPIQAKVYRHLLEINEAEIAELKALFGEVNAAVNKLVEKGFVAITEKRVLRDPLTEIAPKSVPHTPNAEQQSAIDEISSSIKDGGYSPFLLYGVTGSGKTLVYLKVLEEAIKAGKKAVFLAPEIALTPWPAAYLADKFPGRVAIAHSGLSHGERSDEWERALVGGADIVVGARSALFSPIKDLGLIIVDEEHETSYKQEEGVKYNARDSALMLAKYLGITVVLGSATPSVETFYNSQTGKIKPLYLKNRVSGRTLPKIELTDVRGKKGLIISDRLKVLLGEGLQNGHQALLFLNRRGFSQTLLCKDCGHNWACLNCSVTLTVHKGKGVLKCHYCDLSVKLPDECPECKGLNLIQPGVGTERVEEEIRTIFPKARVGRMDRDTTQRKGSAQKILEAVEDKRLDILIGTQMVSKGHDFPGITLVGVISGDTSLNIPDFRSAERTFQLITQAAGRAGRGEQTGEVVIQTLNPEHYCFMCAETHDYDSFYNEEIELRRELFYPPFTRLCCLRIESQKEEKAASAANLLRSIASRLQHKGSDIMILGPAPALLAKVRNRYRWQMLVKGPDIKTLHPFLKRLQSAFVAKSPSGVTLTIDMDPTMTV